jgi:S1-C subfamily serine protease
MSRTFYAIAWLIVAIFALSLMACSPIDPQRFSVKIHVGGGHGSGTVIGNGMILTAAHVVEGVPSIEVETSDGKKMPAKVLWIAKAHDIAVIQYEGAALPAAQLACGTLRQGDAIQAFGNPGNITFAKFNGFISTREEERAIWKVAHVMDITGMPGMSGGGVFNMAGKLVGVFTGGYSTPFSPVSGITLMVPASAVCRMLGR